MRNHTVLAGASRYVENSLSIRSYMQRRKSITKLKQLSCSARWQRVQRLETEIGVIIMEVRVSTDVVGICRLEMQPGSWLNRGGAYLVGTAEGYVEVYVRSRFETSEDKSVFNGLRVLALSALAVVPVILLKVVSLSSIPRFISAQGIMTHSCSL